jgi:hypothetical protein
MAHLAWAQERNSHDTAQSRDSGDFQQNEKSTCPRGEINRGKVTGTSMVLPSYMSLALDRPATELVIKVAPPPPQVNNALDIFKSSSRSIGIRFLATTTMTPPRRERRCPPSPLWRICGDPWGTSGGDPQKQWRAQDLEDGYSKFFIRWFFLRLKHVYLYIYNYIYITYN